MLDQTRIQNVECPIRAVTRDKHHFFGYYDRCPWDATGRYLLALETDFIERPPTADDSATLGLIDTNAGDSWKPLATTYAWNWQMATNAQWLPAAADREIIFNAREEGRLVSKVLDVFSGKSRTLPLPVAALSPAGRYALSINFARVARERPGYGYQGVPDAWEHEFAPQGDGVWRLDLVSGEHKLIVPLVVLKALQSHPTMEGVHHRAYDLRFNTDGTRFGIIHRWRRAGEPAGGRQHTRLVTSDLEGRELHVVNDHAHTSHYGWRDSRTILAWANRKSRGEHYFLFKDLSSEEPAILGEPVFDRDGHCTYSPDGKWVLTDTYPDHERLRHLMLYRLADGMRINIGRFFHRKEIDGEIRCDLHPRFSRDGRQVCIDSIHEGLRQVYVLDISEAFTYIILCCRRAKNLGIPTLQIRLSLGDHLKGKLWRSVS